MLDGPLLYSNSFIGFVFVSMKVEVVVSLYWIISTSQYILITVHDRRRMISQIKWQSQLVVMVSKRMKVSRWFVLLVMDHLHTKQNTSISRDSFLPPKRNSTWRSADIVGPDIFLLVQIINSRKFSIIVAKRLGLPSTRKVHVLARGWGLYNQAQAQRRNLLRYTSMYFTGNVFSVVKKAGWFQLLC